MDLDRRILQLDKTRGGAVLRDFRYASEEGRVGIAKWVQHMLKMGLA